MKWVSVMALLLAARWRAFASYQLPVDFVVGSDLVGGPGFILQLDRK